MLDLISTYQSKLRIAFFQGSIHLLLFAILLTAVRVFLVGDWQSIAKSLAYLIATSILFRCLQSLRRNDDTLVAQQVGVMAMLLTATFYVFITPHALFIIGVIILATILFFTVLSTDQTISRHWLALTICLFILALTLRQLFPTLRLDYSLDLLITLYLFPPFFFWICARIAANLMDHLAELLNVGHALESDLRQSELQYQQLLQTMNEGFVVADENDFFVYVNDKFCEISGYARAELIGRRNAEVLHYDAASLQVLQQQTTMRSLHERSTYELATQRKDGSALRIHVSAVPKLNAYNHVCGAFCVVMDITERKQVEDLLRSERALLSERVEERTASLQAATEALQLELQERKQIEDALRKAEEEYRTLFDNVPIGLYRSSLDGYQLRANPALVLLNGYESETEMIAAVNDIAAEWYVDSTRRTEFQERIAQAGVIRNFESEIYRYKSRERIWVSETAILVHNSEGTPLYYQGTVQEITERKASEADQARVIEQLAKVARLKDEFLANMSHELRTPLNSILGMTEALQDEIYGTVSDRQRKALNTVESSGRHLLALINDILDLAKIESGQAELVVDAVDVAAVCEAALRLVQPTAKKKAITVTFVHDPTVKIMMGDGRRIKQILINLLSNAIKFTPEERSIGLEISSAYCSTPAVQLVVWDTGVGIADDARLHLFEPFVQVDSTLSRRYEGSGLGLALVQRMAELHGGTVDVESQVGAGSRFTVTLPWVLPTIEEALIPLASHKQSQCPPLPTPTSHTPHSIGL